MFPVLVQLVALELVQLELVLALVLEPELALVLVLVLGQLELELALVLVLQLVYSGLDTAVPNGYPDVFYSCQDRIFCRDL